MRVDILKTQEINDNLWAIICQGFNECFDTKLVPDELKGGFCVETHTGYAYHAVAFSDDDDLMGYTVFTPTFYEDDLKVLVGGSTFIRKQYREDFLLFAKIVNALKQRCSEEGYEVVVAVPNDQSFDYAIRINRFVHVADLDYYILPLRPSSFLKKNTLKPLDGVTRLFAKGLVHISFIISKIFNTKEHHVKYRLVKDDVFYERRFQNSCYINYCDGKYSYTYRHYDEDGINTIYIMDFREDGKRTSKALAYCIKKILKNDDADAILFVGFLNLCQSILFKTPKRFIPKRLPLTYHVIDKNNKVLKKEMANKEAWDFSLMNFDVR